jgi:glycosyltransferase involved in cell wall biosynthesis
VRILQLAHAVDQDQVGGLERYVSELSAAQVAAGHEVTVVTKRLSPDLPATERLDSGVRLVRISFPLRSARTYAMRYPVESVLRTAAHIRPGAYDVIHAHFPFQGLAARARRGRYVYTFHAPVWAEAMTDRADRYTWPRALEGAATAGVRAVERAAVAGAAEIVTLSRYTHSRLHELVPARAAAVIDGGIDSAFFCPAPQPELGGPPAELLCVGRLTPSKGVHNLLDALPQLMRRHAAVRLRLAGTGAMLASLRERAAELGLAERIEFLGRLDNLALRTAYRRATICVNPSLHHEGFGLATAEALACATAVVGTPVGATPELLAPIDPGLVARGTSPAALAEAIDRVLSAPERLAALGNRGRQRATERWSWTSVVSRYEEVYARVAR